MHHLCWEEEETDLRHNSSWQLVEVLRGGCYETQSLCWDKASHWPTQWSRW